VGFHINVYNMHRIHNYEDAKEYFKNTKAVRGENQSVRRLGDRYEKEKWLRQEIQDGIEVYVAGYYNTDLVRYYPTHKEITLGGYPSLSTQYFVGYMGGVNLHQFEHKAYVPSPFTRSPMVKNNQIECYGYLTGSPHYMNAYDWYAIGYDNIPIKPEQFEQPVKYKFDASQMRELRKPYKKLLKYADTMLKLNDEGMESDDELNKQLPTYHSSENTLALCADEDKTYLAYYYLVKQTQHHRWQSSGGYKYYVNIGMIKRYLDKQIKLENPQVLVEQPVTNS
jgi:hypothetical protein